MLVFLELIFQAQSASSQLVLLSLCPWLLPRPWRLCCHRQILFSFKSRCGNRLKRGDFDRSSDALVLGVRDRSSGGGDGAGELVGVVELTIRQPDGSLPFNWPFPAPWRQPVSAVLACCCTK